MTPITTLKEAEAIAGTLGTPSKMPGYSYGLSALNCKTGAALRKIPGSVCSKCYALKGHYVFKGVKKSHDKRLKAIRHPYWVEAMVFMIKRTKTRWFRWHDSGDLQDIIHLIKIIRVAQELPGVKFWLPTREQGIVRRFLDMGGEFPKNLVVRVSAAMINGDPPEGFSHTSTVVKESALFGIHADCPAQFRGNKCGDCRQCWDRRVKNVSYPLH